MNDTVLEYMSKYFDDSVYIFKFLNKQTLDYCKRHPYIYRTLYANNLRAYIHCALNNTDFPTYSYQLEHDIIKYIWKTTKGRPSCKWILDEYKKYITDILPFEHKIIMIYKKYKYDCLIGDKLMEYHSFIENNKKYIHEIVQMCFNQIFFEIFEHAGKQQGRSVPKEYDNNKEIRGTLDLLIDGPYTHARFKTDED